MKNPSPCGKGLVKFTSCGEGGIRTHGGDEPHNGFRDRPIQPLWHLSNRRSPLYQTETHPQHPIGTLAYRRTNHPHPDPWAYIRQEQMSGRSWEGGCSPSPFAAEVTPSVRELDLDTGSY
jgi:hypothetical protein